MALSLHNLKPAKGSAKKKKRVGRGNASGHGTYSTRGLKGQRSRTGGKNKLKRLGLKKILLSLPKHRGFKSNKPKSQVLNFSEINKSFKDGAQITAASLFKSGLINSADKPVKILGNGQLKIKNLEFKGIGMSKSAKEQVEKMNGKLIK